MSRPLPNYLCMHRLRSGLSQADVAVLLDVERDTTVSRHESFKRLPNLELALAYELLYGAPIRELFAGVTVEVEESVRLRAAKLLADAPTDTVDRRVAKKLEVLATLANLEEPIVIPLTDEEA